MRIEIFVVSFLLFCLFMAGGVLVYQDVNVNYDKNLSTDEFGTSYDKIEVLYNMTNNVRSSVMDTELDDGNAEDSMFKGTFSALKIIGNSFDMVNDVLKDIASALKIPKLFIDFTFVCLLIFLIFAIIYIVRGISQ